MLLKNKYIKKSWGYELWFINNSLYCGKMLLINKDSWSSEGRYHYHKIKDETFFVIEGILILDVEKDGPAERSGLRPTRQYSGEIILGDIISEVSGNRVLSYDDIRTALEKHKVGETIELTIIRDGQIMQVGVQLTAIN